MSSPWTPLLSQKRLCTSSYSPLLPPPSSYPHPTKKQWTLEHVAREKKQCRKQFMAGWLAGVLRTKTKRWRIDFYETRRSAVSFTRQFRNCVSHMWCRALSSSFPKSNRETIHGSKSLAAQGINVRMRELCTAKSPILLPGLEDAT